MEPAILNGTREIRSTQKVTLYLCPHQRKKKKKTNKNPKKKKEKNKTNTKKKKKKKQPKEKGTTCSLATRAYE